MNKVENEKDKKMSNESNDEILDEMCGCYLDYFCCHCCKIQRFPLRFLQFLAKPQCALALLCCVGFLQGFVTTGLVNVVLTTIEKRFGFSSSEAGLIVSSYNIAACLAIPIVTYIGGRGFKPLWIGWGMGLMGLGCLVFASPYFLSPPYEVAKVDGSSGSLYFSNATTASSNKNLNYYKYLFKFAQLMKGFGAAPLYTLGMTYIDENVQQKHSSLYHGIYFAVAAALGPAAGYILGGFSLRIFTDTLIEPSITNTDTSWIGAWWIGFCCCGGLLLVLCIPILLLPRNMPNSKKWRQNRSDEMQATKLSQFGDGDNKYGKSLKDLPKSVIILLANPTFVFVSLANALDFGLISGLSAFSPKYLESMFGLTPTQAAYCLGGVVVVGGSLGYIVGGAIISKAELRVKGMIRMCIIGTLAALLCSLIYMYSCNSIAFAGATTPYYGDSKLSSTNFDSQCNRNCSCTRDIYTPVCGGNGVTYFSPCYAGCKSKTNETTYTNCSCVEGKKIMQVAKVGVCPNTGCINIILFLIPFFGFLVFTILCWTPALQIIVRVVPFDLRSFAVGVQWVFNRAFGAIPVPTIFGKVYDLACAVWSTKNGDQGSCRLYFNNFNAKYALIFVLSFKLVSFGLYILSALFYTSANNGKSVEKQSTISATIDVPLSSRHAAKSLEQIPEPEVANRTVSVKAPESISEPSQSITIIKTDKPIEETSNEPGKRLWFCPCLKKSAVDDLLEAYSFL